MGRSVPEATIAIGRVRSMPFGRSRAEAAARQVRLIEAEGPDEVRAYALESQVEALTWVGESDKAVLPFIKLLRWWDTHPEHFDLGDQNILFWEFGWIVTDLCRNPTVAVDRVERTLDDMERRFNLANRGMERVWCCRLEWELLRRGKDLEKTFTTWLTMPLDDEDSCPACHQEHHADYLLEIGDIEGAVAILEAALSAELTCSREPASILAVLAWCYTEQDRLDEVEKILPRALAEIKAATSMSVLVAYSRLFEVLARGGDMARSVELLAKITKDLTTATPYVCLDAQRHLLAGLVALVAQGHGDEPTVLTGNPTLTQVVEQTKDSVVALTQAFDSRHGSPVQAGRLDAAMAARPTSRPLLISAAQQASRPVPTPLGQPGEDGTPQVSEVLAQAEEAFDTGSHDLAAALFRQAADEARALGWLAQAGWCWAEAARNCQETGNHTAATHDYLEALALLKASGVSLEEISPLFVAWAPQVRQQDYRTFLHLALETYPTPARPTDTEKIEELMPALIQSSMIGAPLLRRYLLARAELRDAVARVMATWGDAEDNESALAMAEESASRFATLGRTEEAAHSWWLAGNVAARLLRPSADANFAMALQGFKSTGQRNRRFHALVAKDYASFLSGSGRQDKADAILASWKDKED